MSNPVEPIAVAGLTRTEIAGLLRKRPARGGVISPALAPYLNAPYGLSDEEYEAWIDRLCQQATDGND